MPHFHSLADALPDRTWLTIGSFDGIHLGHQRLINEMVGRAHSQKELASVITFFPHPVIFLRNIKTPYYLTSTEEKASLLMNMGVDQVITIPFTHDLSRLTAHDFMVLLTNKIKLTNLIVGFDFSLGRNREGNLEGLSVIGKELDYKVHVIKPVLDHIESISSRRIRFLLNEGEVGIASQLLGRNYSISGKIIHGEGRGHQLGIPTTNLEYDPSRVLPRPGIYSTYVTIHHNKYLAVTNIGTNPTFVNSTPSKLHIESHILDFSEDVYDLDQEIEFIQFIRPEIRFDNIQQLKARIQEDILFTQTYFSP